MKEYVPRGTDTDTEGSSIVSSIYELILTDGETIPNPPKDVVKLMGGLLVSLT